MALGEKIRQLDEQVAAAVRRALDDVRDELRSGLEQTLEDLRSRLSEVSPELPESFFTEETLRQIAQDAASAAGGGDAEVEGGSRAAGFSDLREALAAIDRAKSQNEILGVMTTEALHFADRAAVLLLRPEGLVGWVARGFENDQDIRTASVSAHAEGWSSVVQGGPTLPVPPPRCAQLVSQLGSAVPEAGVILPLVLRDRVSAVVYGDRVEAGGRLDVEALQALTYATALALETLALRERESTATLEPAAPPEQTPELEPAPEPMADERAPELEGSTLEEAPPALPEEDRPELPDAVGAEAPPEAETGTPEEPASVVEDVETGAQPVGPDESATAPHGDELLSPVEQEPAAEAVSEETEREVGFEEAPELEPEGFDAYEVELEEEEETPPPPVEEPSAEPTPPIPWRTDEPGDEGAETATEGTTAGAVAEPSQPAGLEDRPEAGAVPPPAPEPPEVEEAQEAEPAEPSPGGPVVPPPDVEGPGWAFSEKKAGAAEASENEAAHDEARRLARLLVSEIQLYNQDAVAEGRRNGDIYERLKDDIDRSRQLYEDRADPEIRESTDYFYQELVRQLGAGDAKSLGI